MSEETIVLYCAPTLADIKTASLFSYVFENSAEMTKDLLSFNQMFHDKDLHAIPLGTKKNRCLVYVYRKSRLEQCLNNEQAKKILKENGYTGGCCEKLLMTLCHHVQNSKDFPHEIGLFLGYPPCDVQGFICNNAQNYRYSGMWKVYENVEETKHTFQKYDRCTYDYCKALKNGMTLQQLAV